MILNDTETEQLKIWIVKRLEDISDADSDVLADYVLALVKSDESDDQVRRNCQENLDDFLKEHTNGFVDDVLNSIATKSFDPSRPQQQQQNANAAFNPAAAAFNPPAAAFNPPSGPTGARVGNWLGGPHSQSQSRKRGFNDFDGAETQNGFGQNRPMKQVRRGGGAGGRGGFDQRGGRGGIGGGGMAQLPSMPALPPGMPPFDPNNPLATLIAMQAMGMPPIPGMPNLAAFDTGAASFSPQQQQGKLPPKRPGERCRDYDNKGFCALGASCPYEHNNAYVVPNQDEYSPADSSLAGPAGQEQPSYNERGRGRGRGRGERGSRGGGRGGRTDFSAMVNDPTNTTIVVEQIPEDKFDEQAVRDYFSEFGTIETVTLQPGYRRIALVKYGEKSCAQAARDSRKAIFDDRFVKVYWYNPDKMPRQQQQHDGARNGRYNKQQQGGEEDVEMGESQQPEEEKIDPVELAKKQEAAQKAHEEKMAKLKEAEAAREELDRKVKAQAAERSKLLAMLAAKERNKTGTPDQSSSAVSQQQTAANGTSSSSNGAAAEGKPTSQTEALKAQLAKLEKEAESMGINPNEEAQPWQGFAPRGRGGYRGRGGSAPRGSWQGARGGWQAGGARGGGAVMRLDNRPRNIAVVFPDGEEMGPAKDEALRQYLLFNDMMDTATLSPHPTRKDAALLSFTERYLAEKFIVSAKEIPHIGSVELAWVANSEAGSAAAAAGSGGASGAMNGAGGAAVGKDVVMEEGEGGGARGEVDWDVDDDERWIIE